MADDLNCPRCGRPYLLTESPPAPAPRPPFDWTPYIRYAIQGVIMLLAGVGAYYGAGADQKAETAAVQSEKNGKELKAHGEELKEHGRKLKALAPQ